MDHRTGWFRTWPERVDDGQYWIDGNRMARIYRYHDGRWRWISYTLPVRQGLVETKEEAKRIVEERADVDSLEPTCRAEYLQRRATGRSVGLQGR